MKKLLLLTALLGIASCQSKNEESLKDTVTNSQGIPPVSINEVVDVFELKVGKVKECVYNGQTYKLSIENIKERGVHTPPCPPIELTGDQRYSSKFYRNVDAYINVETNKHTTQVMISSTCETYDYDFSNDGTNIQHTWDVLTSWASNSDTKYFGKAFIDLCGDGALIKDTPFSIFMAKAHLFTHQNEDGEFYCDFILILTNKK